jgi:hypothetical protein
VTHAPEKPVDIPRVYCRKGENVFQAAKRVFGESVFVDCFSGSVERPGFRKVALVSRAPNDIFCGVFKQESENV